MRLRFTVYGEPKPQGSKKTVPIYRQGKPVLKDGRPLVRIADDNPKTSEWRQEVAQVAHQAYVDATGEESPVLIEDAIALRLTFYRPRPKSHFGSGKNANKLKASAPEYPTQRPDTIKLTRAIEDALTGVIWRDDSQIVRHDLKKRWGSAYSLDVTIVSDDAQRIAGLEDSRLLREVR